MPNSNNSQTQQRRRARQSDGKYQGENPATPDLNIAWEPTEVEPVIKEAGKYAIKPQVTGSSQAQDEAGKYSNKDSQKLRPTFGTVYSTTY